MYPPDFVVAALAHGGQDKFHPGSRTAIEFLGLQANVQIGHEFIAPRLALSRWPPSTALRGRSPEDARSAKCANVDRRTRPISEFWTALLEPYDLRIVHRAGRNDHLVQPSPKRFIVVREQVSVAVEGERD